MPKSVNAHFFSRVFLKGKCAAPFCLLLYKNASMYMICCSIQLMYGINAMSYKYYNYYWRTQLKPQTGQLMLARREAWGVVMMKIMVCFIWVASASFTTKWLGIEAQAQWLRSALESCSSKLRQTCCHTSFSPSSFQLAAIFLAQPSSFSPVYISGS